MKRRMPSPEAVARAKAKIAEEDRAQRGQYQITTTRLQRPLPSEHPDHVCGMHCDGQDGQNSECARLRRELFGGGS